jgi:Cytochrome P460
LAFMVKRKAGFNPASLDWEFLFFDGQVKRQMSAGSTCQDCHGNRKEADGVFGSYLSGA